MVADCIGLDLGRTAIKAVRFRRTLSGRESVEYFHQPMPYTLDPALEPARKAALLRKFLWQNGLYHGDLVTALPCRDIFIRTLSFPFQDTGKLAQVVPFEVENLIPLPLEDVAVGSVVLPPGATKTARPAGAASEVLVTAAPKSAVADHIKFLAEADLDPAAINVDGLALFSVTEFLKREGADVPEDLAVIDLGASKSTLCLIHQGRPLLLRTIPWGGDRLTEALASRYACSFAEAERRKRGMAASQMEPWLDSLLKDIRMTLHAFESTTRSRIRHCWVSGGGSKLREVNGYLARQLELVPVGPRQGFGADCPRAFSVAFGLAIHPKIVRPRWKIRAPRSAVALDLKHIAESAETKPAVARRDVWLAAAGVLVLCLLALADLFVRVSLIDSRVKELKAALQAQFQRDFGGGAAPGEELDQARARLDGVKKALSIIDGSQTRALPVFAQVVKHVPRGLRFSVRELTIENGAVHLEAETDSFEAVEKVKQAFVASPAFQEVAVSDTRVGASAKQVVFRLAFKVQAR
ncbi:MAG: ATPase [Nitrospiraceae bacterium]|nr:MAG: ATPase [Nitrospiraceae bacterium]